MGDLNMPGGASDDVDHDAATTEDRLREEVGLDDGATADEGGGMARPGAAVPPPPD